MKMNKKGFTLIEMLVVIAIIAVLVSIVIPVVGNSTEKAKEAKDAANIRSAIAEITTAALTGEGATTKTVALTQTGEFNQNAELTQAGQIGGMALSNFASKTSVTLTWNATTMAVEVAATPAPTTCQTVIDAEAGTKCGQTLVDGKCPTHG